MLPPRILVWLAAAWAVTLLATSAVLAQTGPSVEVYTSSTPTGPRLLPFERLPFRVTVSVEGGYDTNVGTSSGDDLGTFFSSASVALSYGFGTERTRATLSWATHATYYSNDYGDSFDVDPQSALQLSLSHAVSERLNLNAGIYAYYGIEPDFYTGVGENRRSGNFFHTADSFSASYQWLERFSTVTTYTLGILEYEDDGLGSALNRIDNGLSQQFRFMLLPMTTLIADYRVFFADYDTEGRDATSQFFLVGVSQTLGPRTQGSVFGGAQVRTSDEEDTDQSSPFFSANLGFVVGEKTYLSWNAQYSIVEANAFEASSSDSFSTGLQLSYAITPRISSTLSAYYRHDEYTGRETLFFDPTQQVFFFARPSFAEDTLDFGLNLSYSITPRLSASAGVHYTNVSSELSLRPYSRARYSGGLSYSF